MTTEQTALEKLRTWLATYPGYTEVEALQVDYTDNVPGAAGLFPGGLVEVARRRDILGSVTVENQYNFGLYVTFAKAPGDGTGAARNAEWLIALQHWVQEQSIKRLAPTFGDLPRQERVTAQNGILYDATDEGAAVYLVQLSVNFYRKYEVV